MSPSTKQLMPFSIASAIMLFSLFFGSKAAGIGLLIWTIVFAYTLKNTLFKRYPIEQFYESIEEKTKKSWEKKQYKSFALYSVTLPLMVMGALMIIINIIILFVL